MKTKKRWASTRELLDFLLLEKTPSEDEVLALAEDLDEDHLLDFKSGQTPPGELKDFLRDYLAGFTNVSGGVLVVGITNKRPREVDGLIAPSNVDPAGWAASVVKDIAARISPAPVFKVATCQGKQVLFMATERAPQLIALAENRRLRYPLRIGDQLMRDPQPDIITDLMLGRRAQPAFHVTGALIEAFEKNWNLSVFGVTFGCNVENDSFLHVRNVSVGVVGYSVAPPDFVKPTEKVLQQIHDPGRPTTFVKHSEDSSSYVWRLRQAHSSETVPLLAPFASEIFWAAGGGPFLFLPLDPNHAILDVALCVLADGAAPAWYQVTYEYLVQGHGGREFGPYSLSGERATVVPLAGTRPVVGWRPS
jgi:hypothetical protein